MTLQMHLAASTRATMAAFLKEVEKVPADKLEWSPLDEGRTVLSMVQECGTLPRYLLGTLTTFEGIREMTEEIMNMYFADCAKLDTLEKAVAEVRTQSEALASRIEALTDEEMARTVYLMRPDPRPIADIASYHLMNMEYHRGQICYIQTLYGDKSL
ncbi:MAG: hypothetical protein JST35_11910 [Armatimonadetes bacterium]|nr:hypothetical protein [Armatimonadota bacterium]